MPIAKVIKNRGSQAIRLLKEFRVKNARVYLKKTADGFIVLECDPWEVFEEAAQRLSPEFVDVVQKRSRSFPETRDWTGVFG